MCCTFLTQKIFLSPTSELTHIELTHKIVGAKLKKKKKKMKLTSLYFKTRTETNHTELYGGLK